MQFAAAPVWQTLLAVTSLAVSYFRRMAFWALGEEPAASPDEPSVLERVDLLVVVVAAFWQETSLVAPSELRRRPSLPGQTWRAILPVVVVAY